MADDKLHEADALRRAANTAHKNGDDVESVERYTEALAHAYRNGLDERQLAVLYSNRSMVTLKLGRLQHALADANKCIQLSPKWAKALLPFPLPHTSVTDTDH